MLPNNRVEVNSVKYVGILLLVNKCFLENTYSLLIPAAATHSYSDVDGLPNTPVFIFFSECQELDKLTIVNLMKKTDSY